MVTTNTEPLHGWRALAPTLEHPFVDVVPNGWDYEVSDMAAGHTRGLSCQCQPFYNTGESKYPAGQVLVVHRMLLSDIPEGEW